MMPVLSVSMDIVPQRGMQLHRNHRLDDRGGSVTAFLRLKKISITARSRG